MHGQIIAFPTLAEAESALRQDLVRPPDPRTIKMAENLLIAALFNYRQVTTGESDEIVSYLDVPEVWRELFYRNYAVPMAVNAVWRDGEVV